MTLRIVDFRTLTSAQQAGAARILREARAHMPSAYNGEGEAEAEVRTFLEDPERAALAALEGKAVRGWIGVIESYSHAWELHPLVVDPAHQRRGLGRALTAALEAQVKARGVLTLYLGTDDDYGGTNLFGRELFPDVAAKIGTLRAGERHASGFYRRIGYEVVGLIPDANGPGRPDIMMAKQL